MKTRTCTLLGLLFLTLAKPLSSATKVWYPEHLTNKNTPIQPKPQPQASLRSSPPILQPVLFVSKFQLPKLNAQLPPKLEQLEQRLQTTYKNAHIIITSGYRSKRYNARLGRRLGFTHTGGRVARNSAHTRGKAVDLYATYLKDGQQRVISHKTVGKYAQKIFDKTLVYNDHIHVEVQ